MRLRQLEIEIINIVARKYFGSETRVFLFGSRVDDSKKGGDIDLLIRNNNQNNFNIMAKIQFLAELKSRIGDQKIDVVFDDENTRSKVNFYSSIQNQFAELPFKPQI